MACATHGTFFIFLGLVALSLFSSAIFLQTIHVGSATHDLGRRWQGPQSLVDLSLRHWHGSERLTNPLFLFMSYVSPLLGPGLNLKRSSSRAASKHFAKSEFKSPQSRRQASPSYLFGAV